VWAKLFRARDQYEPRALFRTWLFRVARNHWIDTLRSQHRRPQPLSLSLGEGEEGAGSLSERLATSADGGIESLERRELAERLGIALCRLTAEM
jgi:RNA polymerase sigma-70 factor (ECF subfamily)